MRALMGTDSEISVLNSVELKGVGMNEARIKY